MYSNSLIAVGRREAQSAALWRMTPDERVLAMRRGELSLAQLTEWSSARPEQVPKIDEGSGRPGTGSSCGSE